MRIGLTYDLRDEYLAAGYSEQETAEFDRAETIDQIAAALESFGHQIDRIGNVHSLVARLGGQITAETQKTVDAQIAARTQGRREHRAGRGKASQNHSASISRPWDLVFNIAEGLRGFGREAQVPAVLEAFDIPYTFSDPLVSALTLHKGMTKRVLRDLGVPTTPFVEVASPDDLGAVDLPFPLFVKPLAEGTAKGIDGQSKVHNRAELERACRRILEEFQQPALVEPYLGGREFTVGILGTGPEAQAIGTLEVRLMAGAEPHSYTYLNKERCEELCQFPSAPPEWAQRAEPIALAAWRGLGCRDGGRVDLRADLEGTLYVMELNPLPGLHPTHSDLPMIATAEGMPYPELIRRILDSALRRVRPDMRGGVSRICECPKTVASGR